MGFARIPGEISPRCDYLFAVAAGCGVAAFPAPPFAAFAAAVCASSAAVAAAARS
jgi:hypothetical protein